MDNKTPFVRITSPTCTDNETPPPCTEREGASLWVHTDYKNLVYLFIFQTANSNVFKNFLQIY
jgi:hypothetical protein